MFNDENNHLFCQRCHQKYLLNDNRWKCACGGMLDISFNATFNLEKIKASKPTLWRYREAIPIDNDDNIISFDEGFTPLIDMKINNKRLFIKLDQLFITGTYKDRGASVLISKIKELGIQKIIEDSSGNAGSAIAAYCAKAGIDCNIYVPESTSVAKVTQIENYGAILHKIAGSRKQTADVAAKAAEFSYYASHYRNPFFFQGTKTFAFEIWEQLNFNVPDTVLIPTGNGTLFIGTYLGFKDLLNNNLINKIPKLVAIQSDKCDPIYQMFTQNLNELPSIDQKPILAEGIGITNPLRVKQIIDIIKETSGYVMTVSDDEINKALKDIATQGLFVEPTSASSIAAFNKYNMSKNEIIVLPITGHGLKTTDKLVKKELFTAN